MNTRGRCDRRPMIAALASGCPQGCPAVTSPVEGALGSRKSQASTRGGGSGFWCWEKRQFRLPGFQRDEGRQRVRVGGFASSRERCCKSLSSPHVGEIADRPEAGQRAVHARGRWRLDDRKVVRRPPRTKAAEMPWRYEEDLDAQVLAGLPTALGTGSPKGMFSRVHVMRSVGCRSWFEASWRGVQAEPRGETRRNVERV